LPVPIGLPADVALALEQYNAQIRSPLLTLGVDRTTNSLLVSAPADLTEEIQKLVSEMDQAAGANPAQGLKIIPLKKGSAESVHQALQQMIQDSRRYRRRR
jgi:type II secretory pathway component GspD/PulD (secretin)